MEIYELPPFYLSWSVRSKKEKKYLFSLCLGIFFFTSNFPAAHSAVTAARPRVVSPINVGHGVEFIKIRAVFNCFFFVVFVSSQFIMSVGLFEKECSGNLI